jgi:hypothetical protein
VVELAPPESVSRLLGDLYDTSSSDRHMDCCRAAGCPDGSCDRLTGALADLRGSKLLEHLTITTAEVGPALAPVPPAEGAQELRLEG